MIVGRVCSFAVAAALLSTASLAHAAEVTHYGQLWSEVDVLGRLAPKWKWQLDVQYARQGDELDPNLFRHPEQLTVRPWVHYYPSRWLRLSAFAGVWYNFPIAEVSAREYAEVREAVQATAYQRFGPNTVSLRLRPELRQIEDREHVFEVVVRARTMVKFQRVLVGRDGEKGSLYAIAFDELFGNGGSHVTGTHMFDQNRAFVGVGYGLTDTLTVESGYFNQLQQHAHDAGFDDNHIWQLSLIVDTSG